MTTTLFESKLHSLPLLHRGKVRDNYAVGQDRILMVASDRISAFDVVMGEPIPADAPAEEKVPLAKPVPIYVTYLTALPAAAGEIVFHDDPYGRDGAIRLATAD